MTDASVWVSYFEPDAGFHAETVAWLDGLLRAGQPLFAPVLVLPEVVGAVARRSRDPQLGAEAARQLLAWPTLTLIPMDLDLAALAARVAHITSVRGADAVYIATAQSLGLQLVTWDVEQRGRGSRAVATFSPSDLP